jgi:aminotransferase
MSTVGIRQDLLLRRRLYESARDHPGRQFDQRLRAPRAAISRKAAAFTESVIREMTRLAMEHDAVNLAQGFPDFPAPEEVKRAAMQAIEADVNQYAIT